MKNCVQCNGTYQEKRSDQKYCTTRCKNAAALSRRLMREKGVNVISAGLVNQHTNQGLDLTNIDLDTLKQLLFSDHAKPKKQSRESSNTLVSLLNEKDFSRDLTGELSEHRMKIFYLEKEIEQKNETITDLKNELRNLNDRIHSQDLGFMEKLIENNPTLIPQCIDKLSQFAKPKPADSISGPGVLKNRSIPKSSNNGNNSSDENDDLTDEEKVISMNSTEQVTSILEKIEGMSSDSHFKFNSILKAINQGLDNPMMRDMLLKESKKIK